MSDEHNEMRVNWVEVRAPAERPETEPDEVEAGWETVCDAVEETLAARSGHFVHLDLWVETYAEWRKAGIEEVRRSRRRSAVGRFVRGPFWFYLVIALIVLAFWIWRFID